MCCHFLKRLSGLTTILLGMEHFENIMRKGLHAGNQHFFLFIRPSKTGRIMGSPVTGGRAGGVQFFVRSISPKLFYLGL